MTYYHNNSLSLQKNVKGKGLINSIIQKLPVELHLPGYQYCGPGTKLQKRLSRGDPGINPLDAACKEHDISYSQHKDLENRHKADKILAEKAWSRVKSKDATFGERVNALLVTNAMKAKVKFGMGSVNVKDDGIKKEKGACPSFREAVRNVRKVLKLKKPKDLKEAIKVALSAAKYVVKRKKNIIKTPRVISVPKLGGALPLLIPLFAGLSAIGALSGGAAGIAKAVNDARNAQKQLEETKRHNEAMEAITLGKDGEGLFLKPYRKGLGLYLNPQPKNY